MFKYEIKLPKPDSKEGKAHQSDRVLDFSIIFLVVKLLSEVDQGGEGEDGDGHQDEEEAELLVGLLEGVEQGLQSSEMSDQLVNPQDSHHFNQSDDLSSLPDYLIETTFSKEPTPVAGSVPRSPRVPPVGVRGRKE